MCQPRLSSLTLKRKKHEVSKGNMSIDSLARGAIGPQPSGPKRQRRTAADGFFVPRGMPPLRGRGKKPA
jgi:hypothetical protein